MDFLIDQHQLLKIIVNPRLTKLRNLRINRNKSKTNKSMRGGTPAPSQQYRQKQVNTSLGLRNVGAQYIERSISNE